MSSSSVSAVLFVKDLRTVASFYSTALEMKVVASDEHHSRLECRGFELVVHQIPKHIAEGIVIERPPKRRVSGAIRLSGPRYREEPTSRPLAGRRYRHCPTRVG
jgi:hypothetical protein